MDNDFPYYGSDYSHGGKRVQPEASNGQGRSMDLSTTATKSKIAEWLARTQANVATNGGIPCPPAELCGCGGPILNLKRFFPENWLSDLQTEASTLLATFKMFEPVDVTTDDDAHVCSCSSSFERTKEAASRENSADNRIYYPLSDDSKPDNLKHFQKHWVRGEPVVVQGVLQKVSDLNWEPQNMWSEIHVDTRGSYLENVKAIDSLNSCEVSIFFFFGLTLLVFISYCRYFEFTFT